MKFFRSPIESTLWIWEQPPLAFGVPRQTGRKRKTLMNFNQLTIIGFIGRNAETKQLPNGIAVTRFSVATTRSWKDDKGEYGSSGPGHSFFLGLAFQSWSLLPRRVYAIHSQSD
jgi:hypothetical protein